MYQRSSGLLCHITSLPGPHGIGDLGPAAYRFVDFLNETEQHLWQVLPLGPVGGGDSPYDSRSSFAGNPQMISMEALREIGLLEGSDLRDLQDFSVERVAFRSVELWKGQRLRTAYERFLQADLHDLNAKFDSFRRKSADWLDDFALYQAILEDQGVDSWHEWPEPLRLRSRSALTQARTKLGSEIRFHEFVQFLFDQQWSRLKAYANDHGVSIMGDIPIYVALDSADVWANQEQFLLDEDGQPKVQAGVPPDLFTSDGQLWGNPVYDWEKMQSDDFTWWTLRIQRVLQLTDIVRIDHFRGFAAGWQVPMGEETARNGQWVEGPGTALFENLQQKLGTLPIVVEDLGVITPDVEELRDGLGYPGMKVLQFAFGDDAENPYLPHNAVPNSMIYTGTHDNDTSRGWYESASRTEKEYARKYLQTDSARVHHDMIREAWKSVSVLACAPVQDLIGLGTEARMNVPGEAEGNWAWRLSSLEKLRKHGAFLKDATRIYGRDHSPLG